MKKLLLMTFALSLLAACEQRVETPANAPTEKVIEKNTTVVTPDAEKK